jgi:mannosyl-3-phosphoglycerate phosphatase
LLAPRHLIFTSLDGALLDSRGGFAEAEEALVELDRHKVPLVIVTHRTRAELDPIRRKIGHNHPFITEGGGGIFFPDAYLNVKIPDAQRIGRYLGVVLGRPYDEVCTALDELATECGVGVAGFHHMNLREVADNTGLRPRDAELAREREFDEPFYFTTADDAAIGRFVELAKERGFTVRPDGAFWHISGGCDAARAVRMMSKLFRDASRSKLRAVGIASSEENPSWLQATDQTVLLSGRGAEFDESATVVRRKPTPHYSAGPAGWNQSILDIIG